MIIRKATINDAMKIYSLISEWSKKTFILHRSFNDLCQNIRDFWVVENNNEIIGCGALHIVWSDLGEIRSLIISKKYQGKGLGTSLVNLCFEEAKNLGLKKIFVLTAKPDFFKKLGFKKIEKEKLPQKVWHDCIDCPHFFSCKEVALIKKVVK